MSVCAFLSSSGHSNRYRNPGKLSFHATASCLSPSKARILTARTHVVIVATKRQGKGCCLRHLGRRDSVSSVATAADEAILLRPTV